MIKSILGLVVGLICIGAGVAVATQTDLSVVEGFCAAMLTGFGTFGAWKCAEYLHSHVKHSSKNRKAFPEEKVVAIFFGFVYIGLLVWLVSALKEGRFVLAFIAIGFGIGALYFHLRLKVRANERSERD